MNPSATTSTDQVSHGSPDEVIRLKCPSCHGGLNLQRQHLGISGSCVHCQSPIRAVERPDGEIIAETPGQSPPPQAEESVVSSFSQMAPAQSEATRDTSGFSPPTQPEIPEIPVSEPETNEPAQSGSPWGFPKPVGDKAAFPPPQQEPSPAAPNPPAEGQGFAAPAAQDPPSLFGNHERIIENIEPASAESTPSEDISPQDEPATAFGMPMTPEAASAPAIPDQNASEASDSPFGTPVDSPAGHSTPPEKPAVAETPPEVSKPKKDVPPLFAQPSVKSSASSLFVNSEEETKAASGSSVPPASPFPSPPSSDDDLQPGFAEALFPQENNTPGTKDTGTAPTKLPSPPTDFGPPKLKKKETPPEPEAAPPVQNVSKSRVFKEGSLSGVASTITKLMRVLIVLTLLGGFGYAAFILTPPEKVAEMKVKIKEWLKPGAVLKDYLPFEVSIWEEEPVTKEEPSAPSAETTEEIPTEPVPAPVETGPVSTEDSPASAPNSGPDPSIRPAPAVTPDQIADSLPAE